MSADYIVRNAGSGV